eukprot:214219_1
MPIFYLNDDNNLNYLCPLKTLNGNLELKTINNSLQCKALTDCVFIGNFILNTNTNNNNDKYIYEVVLNTLIKNDNYDNGFGYGNILNDKIIKITESWTYRNGELYHNDNNIEIKAETIELKNKQFIYENNFDRNGIIYAIGSNFGQ